MGPLLREITREITTNFVSELKDPSNRLKVPVTAGVDGKADNGLWQMFLSEMAKRAVRLLKEETAREILKKGKADKNREAKGDSHKARRGAPSLSKALSIRANGRTPEEGLAKAEEKLTKIFHKAKDDEERRSGGEEKDVEKVELDDLDEVDLKTIEKLEKKGVRVIYPNLKYRKPKYQNVSEVLKYVESDQEKPEGVKLVIMNFND